MKRIYIGIDPGINGGIAILENREVVLAFKPPTKKVLVNKKEKKEIDFDLVCQEFEAFTDSVCYIEKSQPMSKQGVTSMFNYGVGYGSYKGILTALKIPFQEIRPQTWKKEFDLTSDKSLSILTAECLFPKIKFKKTHDGIAEALLIAEYARRKN